MFRIVVASIAVAAVTSVSAQAALQMGVLAPEFKAQSSMGGKVSEFSLAAALKKGPIVLYFYPAAFTSGCTQEAHDFADATDQYKALGATVIGVSHDDIEKLNKFSVSECRSKFPVAADTDGNIAKSYDAMLDPAISARFGLTGAANRTSYVITPDDKVLYSYTAASPDKHVENTLAALKTWRDANTAK